MKPGPPPSSLHEKQGIAQPEALNADAVGQIRAYRKKEPDAETLIRDILSGNRTALSRGITLMESTQPAHLEKAAKVMQGCLPASGQSIRIGITGVPGVGKSTFIEAFGKFLTASGKKVAVLAIDPSSSLSHGSILGDKTRMEELVKDEHAYIRPSASGEALGGVARKTREAAILCEAAGYDVIIIETVGVGQSETAVHSMVDFFLLLKISGAGDELQGIKRGIMEMADGIVINKADGDNVRKAQLAKTEFGRALHLFPPKQSGWQPKASTCSSVTKEGIPEIWDMVLSYLEMTTSNGFFKERRNEQNVFWMEETIRNGLQERFNLNESVRSSLSVLREEVEQQRISPFAAAQSLLQQYFGDHFS